MASWRSPKLAACPLKRRAARRNGSHHRDAVAALLHFALDEAGLGAGRHHQHHLDVPDLDVADVEAQPGRQLAHQGGGFGVGVHPTLGQGQHDVDEGLQIVPQPGRNHARRVGNVIVQAQRHRGQLAQPEIGGLPLETKGGAAERLDHLSLGLMTVAAGIQFDVKLLQNLDHLVKELVAHLVCQVVQLTGTGISHRVRALNRCPQPCHLTPYVWLRLPFRKGIDAFGRLRWEQNPTTLEHRLNSRPRDAER
ncbi:hypothetical protein MTBLM5_100008 [Magnetospirillum sp. LM-5]|nr:hypothetical protein MTBLM5_100008 [Magnetospirillum sp. LM-5]